MKRYEIVSSSGDLIEEVADRCVAEGDDYSQNLVVFPGKRPAHFLRKRIAQRRGAAFIPPAIFSIEEFIDHMYEKLHANAPRKLETIDAVAFLFEIHRDMEKPLGGKEFLNLETFFPLGLRIYRDLEELLIEGIEILRLRAIDSLVDVPLPPEAASSLQSLSFFFDNFYGAIEKEGFSSRSERFRYVASEIGRSSPAFERTIFSGFYALTECERRLFRALLSREGTFFLFQAGVGVEEKLSRLGLWIGEEDRRKSETSGEGPEIFFHKSPDSHGQVFDLAGLLGEQMKKAVVHEGGAFPENSSALEKTVIVLPSSETLFPLLYHALPLVPHEEYNVSLGYPLERTPTWGFLNAIIQVVTSMDDDRLYIPDYLGLVLHPYAKNIYMNGSAEITRIIFHALEEELLEGKRKNFVRLEEIEAQTELFELVAGRATRSEGVLTPVEIKRHLKLIHDTLIRKACIFVDIKDFAAKMMEILAFVYDHSSARLHPYFHPFAESFMKELDNLKKSRVRDLSFAERNSYFYFLRKYVAQCFTPFEGTPLKGVQVLGFLETRNLRFDRTYVLDVNEEIIPDTRKEGTLLPLKVRQILDMPTYKERDMLSAYYFHALVKGSREVHLFFAENGAKEKSRFVEQLLWERQKKEHAESTSGYIRSLRYRLSLESARSQSVPKTPPVTAFLESRTYDATSLDVYLTCPLQFYYRYVLDLSRREEVTQDVERLDIGRIVHEILFTYFDRRKHRKLVSTDIDLSEMDEVASLAFQKAFGPDPIGRVYLLKQQIMRQMAAFLDHYQMPLVERVECEILHLEHRLEIPAGRFRCKGILDRIEKRDGRICVIDYKTSSRPGRLATAFDKLDVDDRESWKKAMGSLQLPFYLFLCEGTTNVPVAEMRAMFLLLGKVRLNEGAELRLFGSDDDVAHCYAKAKEVILALIREITNPEVPFDGRRRAKDACRFCDFRRLCATE